MPTRSTTISTLLLGATAAATLAFAPIASADDPPPADPNNQQQQQPPVDPAGVVGSAANQASQAMNGQPQGPAISPYPTSGPPGGVCARMNGFPIYIPPGGIPSEMASGIPSGPVHAGNCTSKDTVVPVDAVQRGTDAASQIAGAATPPGQQADPSQQQPPPPGQ